jgi:hypothetical protein
MPSIFKDFPELADAGSFKVLAIFSPHLLRLRRSYRRSR